MGCVFHGSVEVSLVDTLGNHMNNNDHWLLSTLD